MTDLLKQSITGSLTAQWSTLFVNFFGLAQPLRPEDALLKKILGLETGVQIIELIFYTWYKNSITNGIQDVTRFRYYDWALTTPTMLFSTMLFYEYLYRKPQSIQEVLAEKGDKVALILLLNFGMLVFGYLQEIGLLSIVWSSILGFACFAGSFYLIYKEFVEKNKDQGIYYFTLIVWSIYGFAAMLPNVAKNISYNLLDVVAKNFYGVYLSYYIYTLASAPSAFMAPTAQPKIDGSSSA